MGAFMHTDWQPPFGFFVTPIQNSTIGPLYTFIGTRISHPQNPENMAVQMAAPTVRGGTGPSGSPKNQLFSKSCVTKCVTYWPWMLKKKYLQFPDPYQTVADIQFLNALNFILYEWSPISMLRPK